jgi:hypothetical protein
MGRLPPDPKALSAPRTIAPYFIPAAALPKHPDADGFLQRWLLLEPISKPNRSNNLFVGTYVRAAFNTEYFPDQFAVVPHNGDKVTVGGQELAWHGLDSSKFDVDLFRFAYGLNKPTYGVIFWEERADGRRFQLGVHVVAQRQGCGRSLRRPAHGDGRRRLQTAHTQQRPEYHSGRRDKWARVERLLCPIHRRQGRTDQRHNRKPQVVPS